MNDVGPLIRVEIHDGPREELRPLFELAEDSSPELDSYLHLGRVLVAVTADGESVGHLQLVDAGEVGRVELKNMAVAEALQGRGVGRALVRAAVELAESEGCTSMVVATAAADIGNLRFYQRLGFRMGSIERDAFTAASGYPPGIRIDGIDLRDRVWLDQPVGQRPRAAGAAPRHRPARGAGGEGCGVRAGAPAGTVPA